MPVAQQRPEGARVQNAQGRNSGDGVSVLDQT